MSLIQHWTMQDNAANTVVVAAVGNNGVLSGGRNTSALHVADGPGSAFPTSLLFNGSADFVDVTAAAISYASTVPFSFCCWVKPVSFAGGAPLIGNNGTSANKLVLTSTPSLQAVFASTSKVFALAGLVTGVWQHIFFYRDNADTTRAYRNAVQSGTGGQTIAQTFAPIHLAAATGGLLSGNLADVRVYNSDESANIAAIMGAANPGVPVQSFLHSRRQR